MKKINLFFLLLFVLTTSYAANYDFKFSVKPIPQNIQQTMKKYTWRQGCPVSLNQLSMIQMKYWGMDNKPHMGTMIVNQSIAMEVVAIFRQLYLSRFPIAKIQPLYEYKGSDEAALADNNTGAFNCRMITGSKTKFSNHAYGRAIDINPVQNPYIKGKIILPPAGKAYENRLLSVIGMIHRDDFTYQVFTSYGWQWGGDWQTRKDYQHFEKPAK